MKNAKVGEEYLFSNDGVKWEKGELDMLESWDHSSIGNRYHANEKIFKYCAYTPKAETKHFNCRPYIAPCGNKETTERKLYTQSMHDNGEPIEVGMWFNYVGCEVECLLPADDSGYVIYGHNGDYGYIKESNAIPFPDPVELLDGKAYIFESNGSDSVGIYKEKNNKFLGICTYYADRCTNIRELTIKDKWHV